MRYHFTDRAGWDGILADKRIELSTINVEPGQLAVVWFSSNGLWDNSARANKNITLEVGSKRVDYKLSFPELCNGLTQTQYGINIPPTELYRISVEDDVAPMAWSQYRAESNTPKEVLDMMEQEQGVNPNEWFAGTVAVQRDAWQAVHRWSGQANDWLSFDIPE